MSMSRESYDSPFLEDNWDAKHKERMRKMRELNDFIHSVYLMDIGDPRVKEAYDKLMNLVYLEKEWFNNTTLKEHKKEGRTDITIQDIENDKRLNLEFYESYLPEKLGKYLAFPSKVIAMREGRDSIPMKITSSRSMSPTRQKEEMEFSDSMKIASSRSASPKMTRKELRDSLMRMADNEGSIPRRKIASRKRKARKTTKSQYAKSRKTVKKTTSPKRKTVKRSVSPKRKTVKKTASPKRKTVKRSVSPKRRTSTRK